MVRQALRDDVAGSCISATMEDTRFTWNKAFLRALEHDIWGQVEEASDGYQQLQVAAAVEAVDNVLQLPNSRREGIAALAAVLKLRIQELSGSLHPSLGTSGMQAMKPFMERLIISDVTLPAAVAAAVKKHGGITSNASSSTATTTIDDQQPSTQSLAALRSLASRHAIKSSVPVEPANPRRTRTSITGIGAAAAGVASGGTLRGSPAALAGDTTLSVDIRNWALKDGCQLVQPRIVVTVRDSKGQLLEAVQETPVASSSQAGAAAGGAGDLLHWNVTCHLQTPINRLPKDAAIFLELRHWKAPKQKVSTKAYSYVELVEVPAGGGALTCEVYKKPVVAVRKGRPSLLTTKPLYLQLVVQCQHH